MKALTPRRRCFSTGLILGWLLLSPADFVGAASQQTNATLAARSTIGSTDGNLLLLAAEANSQLDSRSKTKSVTVGAALAGTVGGQITRAYDMAKAAQEGTGNSRLDGALALKAGYDAYKAIDGAGKAMAAAADSATAANGAKGNGSAFGVSVSIGTSSSKSESHDKSHSERGTNVQAENIAITAHETDITLTAQRDIRLLAATNTQDIERRNKSSNASLGVTFGVGQQSGVSFQIGASQAKGKTDGHETTYDNTRITAGETLALKSGGDTTLRGAQVGGQRVEAEIGGRLDIETLQDRSDYQSKQSSSGFSLSLCIPPICYGTSSGSVSAAQQKIDHSYQSAVGQSGIAAGDGGFNITVGGETRLKGGAITSTADAAQNRLSTRSLSYEDLTNVQKTRASSASLSLAGGIDVSKGIAAAPSTSLAGQAASNLLANLGGQQGLPESDRERSQTLAVISPATITLTGTDAASQQAATTLTGRDPKTANEALTNTLTLQDAARVERKLQEAQQNAQAASLIGQVAAGMIGDLSSAMKKPVTDATLRQQLDSKQASGGTLSNVERYELARLDREGMSSEQAAQTLKDPAALANYQNWQDGGANKVVLHGLAGVIQAKVGNGSALVGAASGAVNEALIPEMAKFLESQGITPEKNLEEYKGYLQLGSALLGAGLGAIADGKNGAALGATVAHNATTYNFLGHLDKTERDRLKAKSQSGQKLSAEESARLVYLEAADQMSDGLLEKYRNGGSVALSRTELENLSIYLGQYKLQDGASATNTLILNGPQAVYSYPFAGTAEMQLAYMDKLRADKTGWDKFWNYISGRSLSADEDTFNQARINAGLFLNTAPNESFLPTSIKREGMFAEIDAIRNSALATTGYLGATFVGTDADTRRNLTLTLSTLSDIGSSFILPTTSISPLFGKTTATVENGGAKGGATSTAGTASDSFAVVAKPTYVFRGDGRPPAQIFDEGFKASGTNTDVLNHATTNTNSGLISTSSTPNVAREFADIQVGGYVYTVRKPPQTLDVNATLGAKSPYPQEFEIAVPGAIRPLDILGARQVGADSKFLGPFVKNPGFQQ